MAVLVYLWYTRNGDKMTFDKQKHPIAPFS